MKTMTENYNNRITDSTNGLSIPFGKSANNTISYKIACQKYPLSFNGLVVGTMNSGKTNFLNVLILQSVIKYSPAELNIVFLDFKTTTNSTIFHDAKLPHMKQLIMTSNPIDGYAVLMRIKKVWKKRKELFDEALVDKIEDYNEKVFKNEISGEKLPRILVIIDEAHTLFTSSKDSCDLMRTMITQARSFGIHFILSTQTLNNFNGCSSIQAINSFIDQCHTRISFSLDYNSAKGFYGDSFNKCHYVQPMQPGEGYITHYYCSFNSIYTPLHFQCAYISISDLKCKVNDVANFYRAQGYTYNATVHYNGYKPSFANCDLKANHLHLGEDNIYGNDINIEMIGYGKNVLIYTLEGQSTATYHNKRDKSLLTCYKCVCKNFTDSKLDIRFYDTNQNQLDIEKNHSKHINDLESDINDLIKCMDDASDNGNSKVFVFIRNMDVVLTNFTSQAIQQLAKLLENGNRKGIYFIISAGDIIFKNNYTNLLVKLPNRIVSNMNENLLLELLKKNSYQTDLVKINEDEMLFSNIHTMNDIIKYIPYE